MTSICFISWLLLLSHTGTIIYWTNNGTLTCLCTLGPILGQYIAPVLAQCLTITTPALGQYSMPVRGQYINCVSTCSMLDHCWPSAGAIPYANIGLVHSLCAAYILGQYRLYRPVGIGPVLAQYCHVSWKADVHVRRDQASLEITLRFLLIPRDTLNLYLFSISLPRSFKSRRK